MSTTTNDDRIIVNELLPISKIDNLETYAYQMFAANSDFSGLSTRQILLMGCKIFVFNDQRWGISILQTIDPNSLLKNKEQFFNEMINEKKTENLTGIFLSIVDIFKQQNFALIIGEAERTVLQEAFHVTIDGDIANLGSRISRKKDIIPDLEEYFKKQL